MANRKGRFFFRLWSSKPHLHPQENKRTATSKTRYDESAPFFNSCVRFWNRRQQWRLVLWLLASSWWTRYERVLRNWQVSVDFRMRHWKQRCLFESRVTLPPSSFVVVALSWTSPPPILSLHGSVTSTLISGLVSLYCEGGFLLRYLLQFVKKTVFPFLVITWRKQGWRKERLLESNGSNWNKV